MALKELRSASKSWVASIFVGLLVVSFAIWGVNDVFRGRSGRGVAEVGGQWISADDYQRRYRSVLERYQTQANQQLTAEEIQALGLKESILNQLIDQTALDVMTRKQGLAVHDNSLKAAIQAMGAFQGVDGKFDPVTYQNRLSQAGFSPASFENDMRRQIAEQQMQEAVMVGSYTPRGLIEDLILYRGELREVSYILLDASLAGDIPAPDDKTLQAYVKAHADTFTRPELRTFDAVLFRPKDFADKQEVSEQDIKDAYDFDIDKYKVAEKRAVRTIAFGDESSARAAYDEIKSGKKTFEQVGKERGYSEAELAYNDETKAEASDPKVADAAFAAPGPGLIEPVNGALAWTIAEVKSITPGFTKTLAEVHDEIKAKLALDRAQDNIEKIVNQYIDGRAGGETMDELAKRLGLSLLRFNAVDAEGKDIDGKPASDAPETPELVAAAFAAEQGTENDPDFLKGGGEYVVSVDDVQPPAIKPFEKIAEEARADYLKDEQKKRLQSKAEELVAKYKTAGLGAAASSIGKTPIALASPLRRDDSNDVLSPKVIEAVFNAKQNELVEGPAAKGDDYVVASPLAIAPPSSQDRAAGVETLSKRWTKRWTVIFSPNTSTRRGKLLECKIDKQMLDAAASNAR